MALLAVAGPAAAQSFHASLHEDTVPEPTPGGAAVAPWPSAGLGQRAPVPGEAGSTWGEPRGMRAPESGFRDDGPPPHARYLRFDGEDDVLVIEPATVAEQYVTISVSFRATTTGTYQMLAAFVLDGTGGAEPRRLIELGIDEEGRPTFWMDPTDGGQRLTLTETIADGEWHQLAAAYFHAPDAGGSSSGTIEAELVLDVGTDLAMDRWVSGREPSFIGAPGSYHVGGVAARDRTIHPFEGDIASVFIDHAGLGADAAGTTTPVFDEAGDPVAPDPELAPAPDGDAKIRATSASTPEAVRFVVALDGASGASIVAVDEAGTEHDLGAGYVETAWLAPRPGLYRFEARQYAADGSYTVLASDNALAMPAPREPGEIAVAALAATAIVGVSAVLAARGIDLWDIARSVTLGRAQDRFYAATKEARIEKRIRLGSITAALVAMVLMSLILSAGRRLENVVQGAFIAVFLVAGLAAVAFSVVMTVAQAALARAEHATPRYRLWVAGALSLAFTMLAFGIPFGFAGNLSRDPPPGAPPETPRHKALAAIVGICLVVAAAPLFLAIGAFTRFAFAEIAIAIALGGVFVSALPVRPLPGHVVWSWSKPVSLALLAGTFLLQSAYHLGTLGARTIVAIGVAALLAAATLTALRVRGRREPRRSARARTTPPSGGT